MTIREISTTRDRQEISTKPTVPSLVKRPTIIATEVSTTDQEETITKDKAMTDIDIEDERRIHVL